MNRDSGCPKLRTEPPDTEVGFTLLEVLVAMFVLGIAVSSLFALMSRSLSNVERTQAVNRALELGQSKLNEMLITHQSSGDLSSKILEVGSSTSGRWDDLTRWEASTKAAETRIGMPRSVTPVDILFTVYWKRNPAAKENSLLLETTQLWTGTPLPDPQAGGSAR